MRVDCHMHTTLCGHAQGEPWEYVQNARDNGIDLITFTCHVPMDDPDFGQAGTRMSREDLPRYYEMIDTARAYGEEIGVVVLCGIEAEVSPEPMRLGGMAALLEENRGKLDFVLGSLHHQLPVYRRYLQENGFHADPDIIRAYFRNLAQQVHTGYYDSIAHPDLIRIYGTVDPFDPADYETEIREFLAAAVNSDTCLEVNLSGLFKGVFEVHPAPVILKWCHELGVKLTMGSDSHIPVRVGLRVDEIIELLRTTGYREVYYFRERQPVAAPFD